HPETRTPCPPGMAGEVWIASESVAAGYWNAPEATQETFHGYLAGEAQEGPFLRTGDLGFLRNGELFITGRLKDLIIIRGRNLYPQDIEAATERALPFARANSVAVFSADVNGVERLMAVIESDRALVQKANAASKAPGSRESAELDELVAGVRHAVSDEF